MFFSAECTDILTLFFMNIEKLYLYFIHRGTCFVVIGHDGGNDYWYYILRIPT